MIEIDKLKCTADWEMVIEGMRNAMNSWDRSDSLFLPLANPSIGENDLELMKKLVKAGPEHSKFMRAITCCMNITAPLYWWAEFDTYKIGTVRLSSSFMHRGLAKPFSINDFNIHDKRVYDILNPLEKQEYPLHYPYDTDEYKLYKVGNMEYEIYRNGKIVSREFEYIDNYGTGRHRKYPRRELTSNSTEYHEARLGGRNNKERWLWHRLVATVWIDNPNNFDTVDHINGDKGDNSIENLQWVSRSDNIKKGFKEGKYENIGSLHSKYLRWKNSTKDFTYGRNDWNEHAELFDMCYAWETLINRLNELRDEYLISNDTQIFHQIRCLLPSGYNLKATVFLNYAVLRNIYFQRRNHKLDEWRDFCDKIKELPYSELITLESKDE